MISVLGIVYAIFTRMVLNGTQPLSGLLLMAFIVFAGLTLGYVFWAETLKEKRNKVNELARGEVRPGISDLHGYELGAPADRRFVGSVVEDTTRSLDQRATRPHE